MWGTLKIGGAKLEIPEFQMNEFPKFQIRYMEKESFTIGLFEQLPN